MDESMMIGLQQELIADLTAELESESTFDSNKLTQKVVNAITITTKDTEHYKPSLEYRYLPIDEKEKYYTVQVNDVVIFGEVDDVATTRRELDSLLETKYKNNGFLVTAVNEYLNGMSVDNIQIIHA